MDPANESAGSDDMSEAPLRESAEIAVNGEVVGYGMHGMYAALERLLLPDEGDASASDITAPPSG